MKEETRKRALEHIPYGLYVVGSADEHTVMTIVANWAMQVSFSPSLVAIAIEEDSRIRELIERSGYFALNMLPAGKTDLARNYLKPRESEPGEKLDRSVKMAKHGMPFLHEAVASLECRVVNGYPSGDHRLFVGEVVDAAVRQATRGEVLTLRETGWRYQR